MSKGFFITLEGPEGCGKSTQIALLAKNLRSAGYRVVMTREPGGTKACEKIRQILLDAQNSKLTAKTEFFLFLANRSQHLEEVVRPALKQGQIVLCDRFSGSTFAYQHFGRGLSPLTELKKMNKFACDGLKPNLTVLLNIDPRESLKRKGENLSRFDRESMEFHLMVHRGYLFLAKTESNWIVFNGSQSLQYLEKEILNRVLKEFQGS